MAPALYGMFWGIAFQVFTRLLPQPVGSLILWSVISVQLSWGAVTWWRRTGLPFTTAACVTGAVASLCLVVLAALGHPYPQLSPESWVLFAGLSGIGPLFLWIESRVNREKWRQCARHMRHKSVWDVLAGRHIPDLRHGGA